MSASPLHASSFSSPDAAEDGQRRPKKARPLSTAAAARAARAHMYFFAMLHVLLHHNEVLYGGGPLCGDSDLGNYPRARAD